MVAQGQISAVAEGADPIERFQGCRHVNFLARRDISVCILYTNALVVNSGRAYIRVMTVIICEIAWAVAARPNSASAAHRLRHAGPTLPGPRGLDLYAPPAAPANDPYFHD